MSHILTISEDPRLAARLREAAGRDALSHAILLSGEADLQSSARFIAAAMECQASDKPCGRCVPCQKVMRDIHPDVITVQDSEHKNISVEVLRNVRADAYVLPNEGRRKVYIFPDCSLLDPKGQNVLLKVLEEGPPHAAFILCAKNNSVLLPTIRSRVEEWRVASPVIDPRENDDAVTLCRLLSEGDVPSLTAFFADLESGKVERQQLQMILSDARDLLAEALAAMYRGTGSPDACHLARCMGRSKLSERISLLEEIIPMCSYNIGIGHLTGTMAIRLTRTI